MIENLIKSLQYIADNLTLKKDYTEEIEKILEIKEDIKTLSTHQWNIPRYKINQANEKADSLLNWMKEEMGNNITTI
jgi:hypothetical protein